MQKSSTLDIMCRSIEFVVSVKIFSIAKEITEN